MFVISSQSISSNTDLIFICLEKYTFLFILNTLLFKVHESLKYEFYYRSHKVLNMPHVFVIYGRSHPVLI